MKKDVFETPMMKQYMEIKSQYEDCLLFFRLGDFYEFFLEDAKVGAQVLNITLTARSRGKDGEIPMAGVPYHAVDSYLSKLVKAGYKVAICEQVGVAGQGDLVDREVVRVITPGTLMDEKVLEKKENNYVLAIDFDSNHIGLAFADISTGYFHASQFDVRDMESVLADQISRFRPAESILNDANYNNAKLLKTLSSFKNLNIYPFSNWSSYTNDASDILKTHFKLKTLDNFNLTGKKMAQSASAALLGYLKENQKDKIYHIKKIQYQSSKEHVELGRSTIFNLELFSTIREGDKYGSLIHVLDQTNTAMGGRMLKQWLLKPLINKSEIERRLDAVEELLTNRKQRKKYLTILDEISDIERLLSRIAVGTGNARDLVNLNDSIKQMLILCNNMKSLKAPLLLALKDQLSADLQNIVDLIQTHIVPQPPYELKQGGLIKADVSAQLDELRERISGSQQWLAELEEVEKESTGISSLKVSYNKVFGYYIEVTKANLHLVPERYVRKQTLVNAERFITQKLKEEEERVLAAESKIHDLEYEIFLEVVEKVLDNIVLLQDCANAVAQIDSLISFAEIAQQNNYCRPKIVDSGEVEIKDGRHPVVERLLSDRQFVPNDLTLNHKDHQLIILTGPNMAGKSVYIRQTALIILLAHVGSFVPAKSAKISLVDKIFVRSGASDFITSGLSTFMVEMVETAQILNNATEKSLIILDEIGRGTTTYDGVSIAWAVVEYLVSIKPIFAKTLFATHYHELQALESEHEHIKNYQVAVEENKTGPVFLHKVVPGGASHSYGVAVADLAGVPDSVTSRAKEILSKLENRTIETKKKTSNSENRLKAKLKKIKIDELTPIEALNKLSDLINDVE